MAGWHVISALEDKAHEMRSATASYEHGARRLCQSAKPLTTVWQPSPAG